MDLTKLPNVLWLQAFLLWSVVEYVLAPCVNDWTLRRKQLCRLLIYLVACMVFPSGAAISVHIWLFLSLTVPTAIIAAINPKLVHKDDPASETNKAKKAPVSWIAEAEVLKIALVSFCSWAALNTLSAKAPINLIPLPIPRANFIAGLLIGISLLLVSEGGTVIVRGVLDKGGLYPKPKVDPVAPATGGDPAPAPVVVDEKKYNAGRLIGIFERWAIVVFVISGEYSAFGFLFAGKGLIRSKEFETRDFAEYFLLGSFSSTAVAVCVGLILRAALVSLGFQIATKGS